MDTRFAQIADARDDVIREAALDLADGAIVGVPTECVYGLAARADDEDAIDRLFEVKDRPANRPVARILARPEDLDAEAAPLPPMARRLVARHWPGPVTLVLADRNHRQRCDRGEHDLDQGEQPLHS